MLKHSKPVVKEVTVWSDDAIERLKWCFLSTDWDDFNNMDIDETTETMTDYIHFCVDNVLTNKNVIVYPNNKPYITKELKDCINRKKQHLKTKIMSSWKSYKKSSIDRLQNPPTLSYCCHDRQTMRLSHTTHHVLTQWKIHRRAKRKLTKHRQRRQSRSLLIWNKVSGPSAFKWSHFKRNSNNKYRFVDLQCVVTRGGLTH